MTNKTQFRKFLSWSLLIAGLLLLFVLIADQVDARAGGGHNYSSGSRGGYSSSGGYSSGSRSGGGSGGDAQLLMMLIQLVFYYPWLVIPIGIIIFLWMRSNYVNADKIFMADTIQRGNKIRDVKPPTVSLSKLRERDPGFNEAHFADRAMKAFNLIQHAWTDRVLDKAEAFLSDGIYEQFSIQLGEMRERGVIDHMENLVINSAYPVGFQSDVNFDVIHLRIDARCINYRKNEKTGKILDGTKAPEEFAEVWSFMRKLGAKTGKKGGLMEGQCPNCGNPIKIGRLSKCDVCNALLRSGEYDWVLTSITQGCEWTSRSERAIPGHTEMVSADSNFNIQHVKERASVIFWRKIEAERTGNIASVRKVALDEYCQAQQQWLLPDNSGIRRFYTSCAIGSISILGIEMSATTDNLYVEIIWSGLPSMQKGDREIETSGIAINFKHIFVLGRQHGATTRLETTLASAHCPSCGAPESSGTANECVYCGSVMNDGKKEWVLEAVADRNDKVIREALARVGNNKVKAAPYTAPGQAQESISVAVAGAGVSGVELIRWTIAMMLADGKIDEKEMEMIKGLAAKRGINETRLQALIAELQNIADPIGHVNETSQLEADAELIRHLARVALADGEVSGEELAMLNNVGKKIAMAPIDVDMLIKRERRNLFQEAKEAIRNKKL